jgi:hypothetical protein
MKRKHYAYLWFNVDTNEIFYVGIGTGDRMFHLKQRSDKFKEYYNYNSCDVKVYKSGLTEDEARQLERELIAKYKPCCNQTPGGERTNGKKISESLKGRKFSDEHRKNLSKAAKEQWKNNPILVNNKEVAVLDKEGNQIRKFDAKYHVGIWLHKEFGYGKHPRAIQRKVDKYFKSGELFDGKYFFVE